MLACSFRAARAVYPQSTWPRAVRITIGGEVLEPASGAFDVTVAPGENVQAAVDRCPPGGCVLLLPGEHAGPLVLGPPRKKRRAGGRGGSGEKASGSGSGALPSPVDKEVHVFGRGQAVLRTSAGHVVSSTAAKGTLDGLTIEREQGDDDDDWVEHGGADEGTEYALAVFGGALRVQTCEITCFPSPCVYIGGGDPVLVTCT